MIAVSAFLLSTLMATTIPTRSEPVQETIHGVKSPILPLAGKTVIARGTFLDRAADRFLRQTLDAVASRKRLVERLWLARDRHPEARSQGQGQGLAISTRGVKASRTSRCCTCDRGSPEPIAFCST